MQASSRRRRLERHHLPALQEVGSEIGEGSYSVVIEFQLHGLKCAGKKLHRQLCHSNPEEREPLLCRFEEECEILSSVRHPNIVQFLGLGFDSETHTPILIMEYLDSTLTSCLKVNGVLPDEINYSIISDVATAVCYLHGQTKPIMHRDLTPNNVLLTTDMRAKISDLGVAKILNLTFADRLQMTTCPGTQSYMSPEALTHGSTHDCSIDIFAMGVLILHVFCGEWPVPGEPNRVDRRNPNELIPLTEAERRAKFIDMLESSHPMLPLIRRCISNYSPHRPAADQVLTEIQQVRTQRRIPVVNKLQMMTVLKRLKQENQQLSLRPHTEELAKEKELRQLQLCLEDLTTEKSSLEEILKTKEDIIEAKGRELNAVQQQLDAKCEVIAAQKKELLVKKMLLETKEGTIRGLKEIDKDNKEDEDKPAKVQGSLFGDEDDDLEWLW